MTLTWLSGYSFLIIFSRTPKTLRYAPDRVFHIVSIARTTNLIDQQEHSVTAMGTFRLFHLNLYTPYIPSQGLLG